MEARMLSVDDVLRMHDNAISSHGGDQTRRTVDRACVEKSTQSAVQGALYMSDDGTTNVVHTASLTLFYLVKNHCFVDGNKRVAWLAAVDLFARVGMDVVASDDDCVLMVWDVASNKIDRDGVVAWFAADGRLRQMTPDDKPTNSGISD